MIPVSDAYEAAINADQRHIKPLVIFDFANEWGFPFVSVVATSQYDETTPPEQAVNGRFRPGNYVSDGYAPNVLRQPEKGWWSGQVADANGYLATAEVLEIEYAEPVKSGNFWVVGQEGIPGPTEIFSHIATTQADFQQGTLDGVVATVDGNIELAL
jgi:hypothetical protein